MEGLAECEEGGGDDEEVGRFERGSWSEPDVCARPTVVP